MGAIEPSVCGDKTTLTRLVKQQNATAKDGDVLASVNFGTDAAGEIIPNSRADAGVSSNSWTWLPGSSSLPSVASTSPGPAPASLRSSLVPGFQQPAMTISNWEARTKFLQADYYSERVSYGLAPAAAPQPQPRALLDDLFVRNDDLSLSCSHPSSSFSEQQHQFLDGSSYSAGAASHTPPAVGNLELLLGSSSVDYKPSNTSTWFSWRQDENFTGCSGIDDNSFTPRVGGQFLWPVYSAVSDNSKQQQNYQHQGVPTKRASSSPHQHPEAKRLKSSPKQQRPTKRSNAHKKEPALNTNLKPRAKQGCANDPQSIAARQRRERISERLKILQELIPDGSKVDLVTMLEKAINYVKFLQLKVKVLMNDEYWPKQSQDEEVEENEQRKGR